MSTKNYVTRSGLRKLQEELHQLVSVESKISLQLVSDAIANGSKDENDEYLSAKENYQNLSNKIGALQEKIRNSEIIVADTNKDQVSMLSTVLIINNKTNQEVKWTLVPENEIDIKNGKISFNSPIGSTLLGKKIGESVEVKVPAGTLSFLIKEIL